MAWVNLNTIYATKSEVNSKVPNTRTINGKALSSNVTLGASDIKLSDDTTLQSAWDSISRVRYTLKSGSSSSVIKLDGDCSFADSNGYINLVVFNKLAYVYWRGLNLHSTGTWADGFTINKKLANNNAWIDVVLSNGKSNISDCGFEARGDTCVLVFNNKSSGAVKTSAFTILELA